MGHIMARATFYNALDYIEWIGGRRAESDVRRVEVEALIDTGATYPALPIDLIEKLGLTFLREVDGEVAGGTTRLRLYGIVLVQIEDRIAICPIIERPRGTTPIIGVTALEQMGFRVDPVTGKLVKGLPLMLTQWQSGLRSRRLEEGEGRW